MSASITNVSFVYKNVSAQCLFCDYVPKNDARGYPRKNDLRKHTRRFHTRESVLASGSKIGQWFQPVPDKNILWFRKPVTSAATHGKDGTVAFCFDCHHYINFGISKTSNHLKLCENHICVEKRTREPTTPKSADGTTRPKNASETAQSKWEGLRKLKLSEKLLEVRDSCFLPEDEDDPTEEEYQSAYDEFMSLLVEKATQRYDDEEKRANQQLTQRKAVVAGGGAAGSFGASFDLGLGRT